MTRELNECIDCKGFASLIMDFEWSDLVVCRILVEDLYQTTIHAKDQQEAKEIFRSGSWKADKYLSSRQHREAETVRELDEIGTESATEAANKLSGLDWWER